jgi:stage III sporulation protein SpoIIIAA
MLLADDLNKLLDILPQFISTPLQKHSNRETLIEIVLDIGRRPEARFADGTSSYLSYRTIVWQDLDYLLKRLGKFSGDNRAGIEKTLHRISALRNRQGNVIGLTCRIGRAIFGTVSIIRDLLESKKSILLLGRPGVGKTTTIREMARVLSDGMKKRVIIIDTSNEIAGDGDLPHPSIGKARRMQVSSPQNQHQVMIEAVENHMPEIIIIDEIGTELEATAARTIAERGVLLIGTAHGSALENLIKNPTITDLIGGVQYVTLGDEEAKKRGCAKSILERKAPPTFEIGIEIHNTDTWIIHNSIEQSVDLLLQGQTPPMQKRNIVGKENQVVDCEIVNLQKEKSSFQDYYLKKPLPENKSKNNLILENLAIEDSKSLKIVKQDSRDKKEFRSKFLFIYIYGINHRDLKSLIKTLNLPMIITKEIQYADAIIALSNLIKNNKKLRQISHSRKITIHKIQSNGLLQIAKALKVLIKSTPVLSLNKINNTKKVTKILSKELLTPLEETRLTIEEIVIQKKIAVELNAQPTKVRKLQHALIQHYQLDAVTIGAGTNCRIRIYPTKWSI